MSSFVKIRGSPRIIWNIASQLWHFCQKFPTLSLLYFLTYLTSFHFPNNEGVLLILFPHMACNVFPILNMGLAFGKYKISVTNLQPCSSPGLVISTLQVNVCACWTLLSCLVLVQNSWEPNTALIFLDVGSISIWTNPWVTFVALTHTGLYFYNNNSLTHWWCCGVAHSCNVKPHCVLSPVWEVIGDWKEAGQDSVVVNCTWELWLRVVRNWTSL